MAAPARPRLITSRPANTKGKPTLGAPRAGDGVGLLGPLRREAAARPPYKKDTDTLYTAWLGRGATGLAPP